MMPLVQSISQDNELVVGLLVVVVSLLILGCATTRGMRPQDGSDAPTKRYGLSVVYPYPQPVVFERARQAVENLEFTIEEAGTFHRI